MRNAGLLVLWRKWCSVEVVLVISHEKYIQGNPACACCYQIATLCPHQKVHKLVMPSGCVVFTSHPRKVYNSWITFIYAMLTREKEEEEKYIIPELALGISLYFFLQKIEPCPLCHRLASLFVLVGSGKWDWRAEGAPSVRHFPVFFFYWKMIFVLCATNMSGYKKCGPFSYSLQPTTPICYAMPPMGLHGWIMSYLLLCLGSGAECHMCSMSARLIIDGIWWLILNKITCFRGFFCRMFSPVDNNTTSVDAF